MIPLSLVDAVKLANEIGPMISDGVTRAYEVMRSKGVSETDSFHTIVMTLRKLADRIERDHCSL